MPLHCRLITGISAALGCCLMTILDSINTLFYIQVQILQVQTRLF